MTDKLRAASKLALEALEEERRIRLIGQSPECGQVHWESMRDMRRSAYASTDAAINAMRAALEDQPAEQQEPVAIVTALSVHADGVVRSSLNCELPLMMELYAAPQPKAEQPAEQEPVAWMPIATAPKGRIVLVHYKNSLGNGRTMRARYYLPETLDSDTTESGWADEGWYEESEAYEYLMPLEHDPTHWMPLPAAPDTAPHPKAEQPQQEPVAWRISYPDEPELGHWFAEGVGGYGCLSEPLYTAPQPAKPPPLAIWQIAAAVEQCKANVEGEFLVEFARAIEAAHGINVPQARGEQE